MLLDLPLPAPPTRFSWIVQGASHGPNKDFDEDLGRYTEAAIIPTRGAFLPEWLLVVPRTPCLSIAELDKIERDRILAIAADVSNQISSRSGSFVIFEHGPSRRQTLMGCGVDQAHLHVVGGEPNLIDRLIDHVSEASWSTVDHADPWAELPSGSDYLMIRNDQRSVRAIIDNPVSQRLRRALADVVGHGEEWNYRSHPNVQIARQTKAMFRNAFVKTSD